MGKYAIYKNYSQIDFTKDPNVKHDLAKHIYPVYSHSMFVNTSNPKEAFLYFYYNTEPRKTETDCPEGCWMIGMDLKDTFCQEGRRSENPFEIAAFWGRIL